jgi:hypothetical protein
LTICQNRGNLEKIGIISLSVLQCGGSENSLPVSNGTDITVFLPFFSSNPCKLNLHPFIFCKEGWSRPV